MKQGSQRRQGMPACATSYCSNSIGTVRQVIRHHRLSSDQKNIATDGAVFIPLYSRDDTVQDRMACHQCCLARRARGWNHRVVHNVCASYLLNTRCSTGGSFLCYQWYNGAGRAVSPLREHVPHLTPIPVPHQPFNLLHCRPLIILIAVLILGKVRLPSHNTTLHEKYLLAILFLLKFPRRCRHEGIGKDFVRPRSREGVHVMTDRVVADHPCIHVDAA